MSVAWEAALKPLSGDADMTENAPNTFHAELKRLGVNAARMPRVPHAHWNPSQERNLLAVAARTGLFKSFLTVAAAVGFDEVLEDAGPFTLLAPTDEAFLKFPADTFPRLIHGGHTAQLTTIVAHHFLLGQVMSDSLVGRRELSFAGRALRFGTVGDAILVNGARIVCADFQAANGVLHGIDRIFWPKHASEHGETAINEAGALFGASRSTWRQER